MTDGAKHNIRMDQTGIHEMEITKMSKRILKSVSIPNTTTPVPAIAAPLPVVSVVTWTVLKIMRFSDGLYSDGETRRGPPGFNTVGATWKDASAARKHIEKVKPVDIRAPYYYKEVDQTRAVWVDTVTGLRMNYDFTPYSSYSAYGGYGSAVYTPRAPVNPGRYTQTTETYKHTQYTQGDIIQANVHPYAECGIVSVEIVHTASSVETVAQMWQAKKDAEAAKALVKFEREQKQHLKVLAQQLKWVDKNLVGSDQESASV